MSKKLKINPDHFRVTIYGSARLKKDDARYKQVYTLAKMIAKEGMDLVTGGGPGLMDAASRGHFAGRKLAGSKGKDLHSIGLTIKLPHEQSDSFHLDIKDNFERFSGRLDKFMSLSNVFVVAPGGVGTILELFYTWQLMQVQQTCHIPIICLGDMWPGLVKWIEKWPLKQKFLDPDDMHVFFLAKNPREAIKVIKHAHEQFKEGGKNICINYRKYQLK